MELYVFGLSIFITYKFYTRWYLAIFKVWPPNRYKTARFILGILPLVSLGLIIYTLKVLASFDVIHDFYYLLMYIFLGFTWIAFGLFLMTKYFDLSWRDDALHLNNKAALFSVTGSFLGLTMIYSGANIGDGPGWWCVIFAGGLGLSVWFLLVYLLNKWNHLVDQITIERDVSTGIRFGFYLLSCGIILGRASAGDWTSFTSTVIEFLDGWPVLILALFALMIERYYSRQSKKEYEYGRSNHVFGSLFWGILYLAFAIISILLLPPLRENPQYALSILIQGGIL